MKKSIRFVTLILALIMCFSSLTIFAATPNEETEAILEDKELAENSSARFLGKYHIEVICENVIDELKLTSSQASWIKETCYAADKSYLDVEMLHARGRLKYYYDPPTKDCNYIAGLNAIFKFSQLIGTSNKKEKILNSMPNISASDKTKVENLCDVMQSYLMNKSGISKEHKQYLIYGFGIHAMGDLFSHRAIVPSSTLLTLENPKADTSKIKYFQSEDFNANILADFKSKVNAGEVYTSVIRTWMVTTSSDENHTYSINYRKGTTKNPGIVYCDNPTFMPDRLDAASSASRSFVVQARKADGSFSNVGFATSTYHIHLHNLATYKKLAGV